jgi:hypothetical protein
VSRRLINMKCKSRIILVNLSPLPLISLIGNLLLIFISFIPTGHPQHPHCHFSIPRRQIRGCVFALVISLKSNHRAPITPGPIEWYSPCSWSQQ